MKTSCATAGKSYMSKTSCAVACDQFAHVSTGDRTELVVLIYAFVTPIFLSRPSAGERNGGDERIPARPRRAPRRRALREKAGVAPRLRFPRRKTDPSAGPRIAGARDSTAPARAGRNGPRARPPPHGTSEGPPGRACRPPHLRPPLDRPGRGRGGD